MSSIHDPDCKLIRPSETYAGKQGFSYIEGISAESAGAKGIAMMLLTVPPGGRAKAHMHEAHETAIYVLSGEVDTYYGDRLQHFVVTKAGDMFYIPPGMPHLPVNRGKEPAVAVIARTDPNEQESVVLLPELEALVPA
ncbi:cupin domain-containing protein [Rhizobium sp. XQZ8]|uniref:cupin domain-containing protein n=1 Tax=Rhizobium populisoli TaxID=2859785 RepID=UPI001CA535DB|nr:cupin domain-containing protein [Rhizobium populisoli]MBW6421344.1 cupin domain-containing protein [Rhizobium populisoli]